MTVQNFSISMLEEIENDENLLSWSTFWLSQSEWLIWVAVQQSYWFLLFRGKKNNGGSLSRYVELFVSPQIEQIEQETHPRVFSCKIGHHHTTKQIYATHSMSGLWMVGLVEVFPGHLEDQISFQWTYFSEDTLRILFMVRKSMT